MNRVPIVCIRRVLASCGAAICLICVVGAVEAAEAPAGSGVPAPHVDASWPKPLPNKWAIGQVSAVAVDANDHIWILHRPASLANDEKGAAANPPTSECCIAAPPVIEFDPQGNVIQGWGGPGVGYDWPAQEHGLTVDYKGNVWISGSNNKDNHILKFTHNGKFLLQIGHPGQKGGNDDPTTLWKPAQMRIDPSSNEVYVADGEGGNRRIIVFDADTGAYKRLWGAYGEKPDLGPAQKYDPDAPLSRKFSSAVHCVRIANDGLVYVCDRGNDRIQVFHKDGTFVKEAIIAKRTLGVGSASDIDFSPDQRYLYLADGGNQKVWILQRDSLEVVGSFGRLGHNAGEFRNLHALAVDSKGNIYTGEVSEGKRAQKFVP